MFIINYKKHSPKLDTNINNSNNNSLRMRDARLKNEDRDPKEIEETRRVCYRKEVESRTDCFPTKTIHMKTEKGVGRDT